MITNRSHTFQNSGKYLLRKYAVQSLAILLLCLPDVASAAAESVVIQSGAAPIETLQGKESAKADDPSVEIGEAGDRTVLLNLDGSVSNEFLGAFFDVAPDGQHVITYDSSQAHSYLYSLDGTEFSTIKGLFQRFTPDQRSIITYSQGKSYLYDFKGVEQAALTGVIRWGTVEGDYLIAVTGDRPEFSLYSAKGNLQATFEGFFRGFVPNQEKLIVTDNRGSRLHRFDGSLESTFDGVFQVFTPDNEGVVTVVSDLTELGYRTLLYDLDGTLRATFKGGFSAFAPDQTTLVTHSGGLFQSWLYGLDGSQQATMKGDFIAFSPDGQSLFTYSEAGSHRYTLEGEPKGVFAGRLVGITSDSQRLIIERSTPQTSTPQTSTPQTFLYDIEGQQISALEGLFVGFISDERRIVTSESGTAGLSDFMTGAYRLYDLEGVLQSTLQGQLLGLTATGNQGLVIYTSDGKSHLYDSFDGTEQAEFEGKVLGLTPDEQGVFVGF